MPIAPPTPCRYPGCPKTVSTPGYCEAHRKQQQRQYNDRRKRDPVLSARDKFYKSRQWRKIRQIVLHADPFCVHCRQDGRMVLATNVDHIIPIARGGSATNLENLQGLCDSCHSRKTAREDGAFGNTPRQG